MTAPAAPAPAPEPPAALDVGALWKRMQDAAEASPRDQAIVDSYSPAAFDAGLLVVRNSRPGGAGGTAVQEMLASLASRAAGRAVRVRIDAEAEVRRRPVAAPGDPPPSAAARPAGAARPPAAAGADPRGPSLRDDPVAGHPLVREVSALFDATIVRIEAAGSLPPEAGADAGADADAATQGDHDV